MHLFSHSPHPLACHVVALRGEALEPGLYVSGRKVRSGIFADTIAELSVDQPFVSTSSLVLVISAPTFGAGTLIAAGMFAHTLHLHCSARRIGFSPIGAFYDRKLQQFLKTDHYILYVLAIGNESEA